MFRWIANCWPFVSFWRFEGMPFEVYFGSWGWPWTSCWRPLGLGPGLARGRQNGLDCTPARAGALFYQDPGIQGIAQGGGGFGSFGLYYQSNNCLIQGCFISEVLDLRLRKVTVELLTALPPRSLVAPSKEGPADIYIYIYIYICIFIYIYTYTPVYV